MMLSLLFTACDSDDDKEYTEADKIAKDVSGEYMLAKAKVGDITYLDLAYNDDNLISTISTFEAVDDYKTKLTTKTEKEYDKDGKVTKITSTSIEEADYYRDEDELKTGWSILEYEKKNLVKIQIWEGDEDTYYEYIENKFSNGLLSESRTYSFDTEYYDEDTHRWVELDEGKWFESDGYLKYEYNSKDLLEKIILVVEGEDDITMSEIKYDDKKNPIEIYKYNSPDTDWKRDPETGEYKEVVTEEGGLKSLVKIEYDYEMKNFLGNTAGLVFPELSNFNMYNAPKKITQSGTVVMGSVTYSEFNEGGYPAKVKYLGTEEGGYTYEGEINLEFLKKK